MNQTSDTAMLRAENLVKTYQAEDGEAQAPALAGVSLSLEQGEYVCVTGRSGSGKSTLLYTLSSLLRPDSGRIFYLGRDIAKAPERELNSLRRGDFSMIFQLHHLMPHLTALENVLLPFMHGLKLVSDEMRETARARLARVGLAGKEDRLPGRLSGGEQQRVAIARALVKSPKLLFADEPTGSLDKKTGDGIMGLLGELNSEGVSILLVTHERSYAKMASRNIEMADGRVLLEA